MLQFKGKFPPKTNPTSEFRRFSFREGISKERFYQLGQWISEEQAYIYSMDDTSHKLADLVFVREFTITLIDKNDATYSWYQLENPVHLLKQKSHESFKML